MSEPISKTQRLLDLITYLAGRRVPATVEEIMEVGGEGREPVAVEVRFQFPRSLWVAARDDGTLVATHEDGSATHRFSVKNTNPFLRWILSMAGEAHVTEPAELRAEFEGMARLIAERHGGGTHD
jgi:predicted DNA-binding transcriptional regulator YafY